MRWPWQRNEDESDIVRTAASERDDRLSAYLDGALSRPDRAAVEADAAGDADLRVALEGMRAVRAGLGGLGINRAPRSFAVQPGVAPRAYRLPRLELYTRVGALAAALALSVTALSPSFTGSGVAVREELSSTTSAESRAAAPGLQDAAAPASPTSTQKQAAEAPSGARAAAPQAPATEGVSPAAPAAAPALSPAGGATTTNAAPQPAPVGAPPAPAPASAPRAPDAFGAGAAAPTAPPSAPGTSARAPSSPAPAAAGDTSKALEPQDLRPPPVELQRTDDVTGWLLIARLVLAASTVILGLAALVLTIRRRASR